MKYLITESQKHSVLKDLVKKNGFKFVSKMVGQDYLVHEVFNNDYNEFLSLYDDLEIHESEENPNIFLYRYKKRNNVMVIDKRDSDASNIYVYINHDLIFGPLASFRSTTLYTYKISALKKWLREVYGLKPFHVQIDSFHPGSEDFGFFETLT
jgi:hypothetical protein